LDELVLTFFSGGLAAGTKRQFRSRQMPPLTKASLQRED
jgi:hypothetical protein